MSLRVGEVPKKYRRFFKGITLADRLREVNALVGFTRLEFQENDPCGDSSCYKRTAPLTAGELAWAPAGEVRGEGIFIQFNEESMQEWLSRSAVRQRELIMRQAHTAWRARRNINPPDAGFPGARYVMLHSFSHALMRTLALECGYTAASIRERIYSSEPDDGQEPMAGILFYTAASDSEGTLGGLVNLGARRNG